MPSLKDFMVDSNESAILKKLKLYGVALIPGYLKDGEVIELNREFSGAISQDKNTSIAFGSALTDSRNGVRRFNRENPEVENLCPKIAATFGDELMSSIARSYYAPTSCSFNEVIFLTNEFESNTPILPWHFDRIQSLKFWFYLTDTTKENGAFEYCPGTHWEGHYRAGYHLSQGCSIKDIPNDIDEDLILNPVTLELRAGDLLVFDADGFHRGGVVQSGKERRVIRSHSYPKGRRYADKRFTAGWWLGTPLNLSRWLKSSNTRVIGDRVSENTVNRSKNHTFSKSPGSS